MAECSAKYSANPELLEQFCAVTGGSKDAGEHLLEACNGDLEMAISMHLDGATDGGSAATGGGHGSAPRGAAVEAGEDVRAPIPQRREVLVDQHAFIPSARRPRGVRSVFDSFRDFEAETRQAERAQRGEAGLTRKRQTLGDLFRPPVELIHKGSFHSAKEEGVAANKWLLVNIQNVQEFACQVLNRDVWSHVAVRELVNKHFVFWQIYSDSEDGKRYMQFYNIHTWPYMAILDPQTGEKFNEWNNVDLKSVLEILRTFLAEHPQPDSSHNQSDSPPCKKARLADSSIVDESEESQMAAAISASLRDSSLSTPTITVSDDNDSNSQSEDSDLETFSDSGDSANSDSLDLKSDLTVVNSRKRKHRGKGKSSSRSTVKNGRHVDETSRSSLVSTDSAHRPPSSQDSERLHDDTPGGTAAMDGAQTTDSWRDHLGPDSDAQTKLLLRFPDGKREPLAIPCSSQLRAVIGYVSSRDVDLETHELVVNFPRRTLSDMDPSVSLQQAGLHPQETVFVQLKS